MKIDRGMFFRLNFQVLSSPPTTTSIENQAKKTFFELDSLSPWIMKLKLAFFTIVVIAIIICPII